jgi:hypothetical protein
MDIIRPISVTDAMLTATNVIETDGTAGAWAVGTPYTIGQTVRVVTTGIHKVYELLVANLTGGNSPEIDVLAAVPKWLELSSTNRWKAFDIVVGSQIQLAYIGTGQIITVTAASTGASGAGTFTRSSGSFTTDGFVAGDVIVWDGWVAASANNNHPFLISSVDGAGMILTGHMINHEAVVASAAGNAVVGSRGIYYKLTLASVFNAIAFLNLNATAVFVTMIDGSTVVYDEMTDLLSTGSTMFTSVVTDLYTYFFTEIANRPDFTHLDIPPYLNQTVEITIVRPNGVAAVGCIIPGTQAYIGVSKFGISVGLVDYSTKTTDPFGNYTVLERAFSKRMTVDLWVPNTNIDELLRLLIQYRAIPLLWIASQSFGLTMVYGFFKDFDIVLAYPTGSTVSIQIEGLT